LIPFFRLFSVKTSLKKEISRKVETLPIPWGPILHQYKVVPRPFPAIADIPLLMLRSSCAECSSDHRIVPVNQSPFPKSNPEMMVHQTSKSNKEYINTIAKLNTVRRGVPRLLNGSAVCPSLKQYNQSLALKAVLFSEGSLVKQNHRNTSRIVEHKIGSII
jgi:hypothetical protein